MRLRPKAASETTEKDARAARTMPPKAENCWPDLLTLAVMLLICVRVRPNCWPILRISVFDRPADLAISLSALSCPLAADVCNILDCSLANSAPVVPVSFWSLPRSTPSLPNVSPVTFVDRWRVPRLSISFFVPPLTCPADNALLRALDMPFAESVTICFAARMSFASCVESPEISTYTPGIFIRYLVIESF